MTPREATEFAHLAKVDYTLQGRAGNTVTMPYYSYIGMASSVAEGHDIEIRQLVQSSTAVSIMKYGVAAQLTDEAVLSGYGDPIGEAASQIATSLDDAMDNALLAALAANSASELAWLLEEAKELLDGEELTFNTETPVYPGTKINYYFDDTILVITWKQEIDWVTYTISEVKIAPFSTAFAIPGLS